MADTYSGTEHNAQWSDSVKLVEDDSRKRMFSTVADVEVGGGHETGRERRGGELRACGGAAGGEDEGLE